MLGDKTRIDNLLLRLALAERSFTVGPVAFRYPPELRHKVPRSGRLPSGATHSEGRNNILDQHIKELQSRFLASHLRGDTVHQREEAIFELKLKNNSKKALELARKNWEVQKEPLDAKIFLQSAIACGDKTSAKQVIEFIEKNKLEDVEINELIKKIKL